MKPVESATTYVVLRIEGFELVVHGIPESIAEDMTIEEPPALRTDSAVKICIPVASLAESRELAEKFGGGIQPKQQEWEMRGFRACDGFDPEGNVIQVRESGD